MTARPSLCSLTVSGKKLILLTVHLTSAFSHLTSKDSKVIPRSFVGGSKVVARKKKKRKIGTKISKKNIRVP